MGTASLNAAMRPPWRAALQTGAILCRSAAETWTEAVNHIARAAERYRQRRDLQALDDHLLKDVGLSRGDVERECRRLFRME